MLVAAKCSLGRSEFEKANGKMMSAGRVLGRKHLSVKS